MAANDNDRFDQWLDSALKEYGNVHPRVGLESRIVNSLEARGRLVIRRRWTLGIVATAATVLALTIWVGSPRHSGGRIAYSAGASIGTRPKRHELAMAQPSLVNTPRRRARHQLGKSPRTVNRVLTTKEPRLEQFPSPRPLSEQEQLLAAYVTQFHERAVLMARAQTELRKQEQQEILQPSTQDGSDEDSE
jgi:hypothetical protein